MPPSYFPLRWESTGDQWWYASPIDWAAANGLHDIVKELLHLDTNLLIKLTSLRRIRRLETVWDDGSQFQDVAKCRCEVAKKLSQDCETKGGHNSLIRAGYGGWLLYTAASAGDVQFVKELLDRDPLLVFGEGEYGITDILYAGARSKDCGVFRLLLDSAMSPKGCPGNGDLEGEACERDSVFKWELMNRAIHAAARGGNLDMLKELLGECSDVLVYRDAQGYTVLHAASGRGQVEVVQYLVKSFDIITSRDNQGNTTLHVAAYRGHLGVVEVLVPACPTLISLTNDNGDTFLHMAVAGFLSPGFRRLDHQIKLVKQLLSGKMLSLCDIVNIKNKDGRTALHMAVLENIKSEVVEILMNITSIDLNIQDCDSLTPLDLLKRQPKSAASEILIRQLISAGGISDGQDFDKTTALVSHFEVQGIERSPGTSFRVPDAEIFLYTGMDNPCDASYDPGSPEYNSCASEISEIDSTISVDSKKSGPVSQAARRLKFLLQWPRRKGRKEASSIEVGDNDSCKSVNVEKHLEETLFPLRKIYSEERPVPLRQRYLNPLSLGNNRAFSCRSNFPSSSAKRKFAAELMHGVIQASPQKLTSSVESPSSSLSQSSISSRSLDKQKKGEISGPSCSTRSLNSKATCMNEKSSPLNKKLMNQYFCFGAQHVAMEDSIGRTKSHLGHRRVSSLAA